MMDGDVRATPEAAANPLAPRPPHFAPKAKRVIYLHMSGAPPHLDLFDYKPELVKHNGEPCPDSFIKGKRFAFTSGTPKLLGTPRTFAQHGQGGVWMSDAVPHLHDVADELCVIKSMYTDQFNHAPAELLLFTGSPRAGPAVDGVVGHLRPRLGEREPAGLRRADLQRRRSPAAARARWGSGFLPSVFQGVQCRSKGDPVLYVSDPPGMDRDCAAARLDALHDLNEMRGAARLGNPETATRIAQYELAFRMQTAVPEVMDISRESKETLEAYGAEPGGASFANNCLLARRLVEKGVRFVQLFDWGWDFHGTGPQRGHPRRPDEEVRDDGQARRRPHQGPAAARPARRHAGRLERRVRPHAVPRGPHGRRATSSAATTIPTASACSWPAAA